MAAPLIPDEGGNLLTCPLRDVVRIPVGEVRIPVLVHARAWTALLAVHDDKSPHTAVVLAFDVHAQASAI
jgi:hypothetical protein